MNEPATASRPRIRAQAAHVAVAMGVMNVATYAFTMLAARFLGPQPYGALAALMATLLVFGVVQLGLQATAARRIAADLTHLPQVRHSVLQVTAVAALGLGLLLLALTPVVDSLLRLDNLGAAALVGVTLVPMTLVGGQLGILQGERRWTALSWVYVANGVPRLVLGVLLVVLSPTAFAAMLGVALSAFVPVLVAWLFLRNDSAGAASGEGHGVRSVLTELFHNSQALLAFFALGNVDILVARNQLDAHQAGLYAAGLILVKAVLFLPQFVVVLAFPSLSTTGERRRALTLGLGLVALAGACCILGAWWLQGLAISFVGGDDYTVVQGRLWLFAVLGTLLAMLQLLVYSVVAQQARRSTLVLWAGLVALVVLGLRVSSWQQLLDVVVAVDLTLLVVLLGVTACRMRRTAQADAGAPAAQ